MEGTNELVDFYFSEGCGRCPLGGTPQCKVHNWEAELQMLRRIVLECGLTEELKWKIPCYTFDGKNVAIVAAFNDYCVLSFFKGVLLADEAGILDKPGENTQSGRIIKFTDVKEIKLLEETLKEYIYEAIEVEKEGLKVVFAERPEPIPEELEAKFEKDPVFKSAFEALTPGRQRGYILHFSQPKQSATRESRIEKSISKIMNGKGMQDR